MNLLHIRNSSKSNEYNIFPTTATAHKIMDFSWNLITGSNDATCHNASKMTTKKLLVS
jgi:hypothetical protein